MQGERHPDKIALREARESAIDRLTRAFVADEVSLDEFEERVDRAYRCRTREELDALTSDLSVSLRTPNEAPRVIVPARSDPSLETQIAIYDVTRPSPGTRTIAVLGNTERRGPFHIEGHHAVLSVLGNVEMDLRSVDFGPGVTTLHVRAVLGNVEITVPPSLIVECTGSGVLGSFSGVNHVPVERAPDEPVLRIVGSAVLGSVEVRTRPVQAFSERRLPPRRG
jgi:hypothetical protein